MLVALIAGLAHVMLGGVIAYPAIALPLLRPVPFSSNSEVHFESGSSSNQYNNISDIFLELTSETSKVETTIKPLKMKLQKPQSIIVRKWNVENQSYPFFDESILHLKNYTNFDFNVKSENNEKNSGLLYENNNTFNDGFIKEDNFRTKIASKSSEFDLKTTKFKIIFKQNQYLNKSHINSESEPFNISNLNTTKKNDYVVPEFKVLNTRNYKTQKLDRDKKNQLMTEIEASLKNVSFDPQNTLELDSWNNESNKETFQNIGGIFSLAPLILSRGEAAWFGK